MADDSIVRFSDYKEDRAAKNFRAVRFCIKCGSRAFRLTKYAKTRDGVEEAPLEVECYNCEEPHEIYEINNNS